MESGGQQNIQLHSSIRSGPRQSTTLFDTILKISFNYFLSSPLLWSRYCQSSPRQLQPPDLSPCTCSHFLYSLLNGGSQRLQIEASLAFLCQTLLDFLCMNCLLFPCPPTWPHRLPHSSVPPAPASGSSHLFLSLSRITPLPDTRKVVSSFLPILTKK